MVLLAQSPDEEDRISSKIFDPTKMKNPNWEHVIEFSAYQQLEEKLNCYKDHAEMMKEAWDKAEDKLRAAVEALEALLNDSQHSDHECGDDRCPVDSARKVLTKLKGGEK